MRNADLPRGSQLEHMGEQLPAHGGVDPGHGLVEEDQARRRHEDPRQVEQLALTAGQRLRESVGVPVEADEPKQVVRLPRSPLARDAVRRDGDR